MAIQLITLVLPVNETSGIRASFAMALPISAPPQTQVKMPPGSLFLSNTSAMILVVAKVTKGVVGAPFLHNTPQVLTYSSKTPVWKEKNKEYVNTLPLPNWDDLYKKVPATQLRHKLHQLYSKLEAPWTVNV